MSDLAMETVVGSVAVDSYVASNIEWIFADGGLIPETFRGNIEWDFTVPRPGVWILQLASRIRGLVYDSESVEVGVSIDGRPHGSYSIHYGTSHEAVLRIVTPSLPAGSHRLKLEIDNIVGRRSVQIDSIEIREPTGPDTDGNGKADWIDAFLAVSDHANDHAAYSRISPFCLEGRAKSASGVTVNGSPVVEGVDESHWFTDLPLEANGTSPYTIAYPSGLTGQGEIFWQATNVFDGGELPVRKGDSLKLGAWIAGGTGSASLSISRPHPSLPSGITAGVLAEAVDPAVGTGAVRIPATGGHYIRLSDADELDGTDRLALSFWAKPDASSLDGVARGMVSKRQQANSQAAYSLFTYTGGRLFIDLDVGTTIPQRIDTGYVMTPQWQKIEVLYDGSQPVAQRLQVSVDGVLRHTAPVPVASLRNLTSNVVIGTLNANYQSGGVLAGFGGLLDEIRITRRIPGTHQSTTVRLDFDQPANLVAQTNTLQTAHQLVGTGTVIHQFNEAEPHLIEAFHSDGSTETLRVSVRQALFAAEPTLLQNTFRYWTLARAAVDPKLIFEPGEGLRLGALEPVDAERFRFGLYPEGGGRLGVAARLWPLGPIAGIGRFNSVSLSDAQQNDTPTAELSYHFGNYTVVKTPITVTDLPPGGTIKVTIFRAGVTFLDGSTVHVFTTDDFSNDILQLQFLTPIGLEGGFCHYLDVYDANGKLVGRR